MATTTQAKQEVAPVTPSTGLANVWDSFKFFFASVNGAGLPVVFWQKPHWLPSQMAAQEGKVVLITGGNSGTGYQTALAYYQHGAKVYIACRSAERAQAAIADIKNGLQPGQSASTSYAPLPSIAPGTIEYVQMDLADLRSVEKCAREFMQREQRLDILFANAGIMAMPQGHYTEQGYTLQFGTNVLGHQRLISLLLPLLQSTSRATPATPARVINLSSMAHGTAPKGGIDYAALTPRAPQLEKWLEYGMSKWGNVAVSNYLDAHYGPNSPAAKSGAGEIISIAVHPGIVATNLYAHIANQGFQQTLKDTFITPMCISPPQGALNQIYAGEVELGKARELSGKYVACFEYSCMPRPDTRDSAAWERLWEWCEAAASRAE